MNPAPSYTSTDRAQFQTNCQRHGLHMPNCGPAAVILLRTLRLTVITQEERGESHGRGYNALGTLIKNKLAVYDPTARHYAITPAGRDWLAKVDLHGLMPGEEAV